MKIGARKRFINMPDTNWEHPSFTRAKELPEPWRSHFPKSVEEAQVWKPTILMFPLARKVLAVARTRCETAWAAYVDAVPGYDHSMEKQAVLDRGCKLPEVVARALFPGLEEVPYAH